MTNRMRNIKGLEDVISDILIRNPQVNILIDRDKASSLGITADKIESALSGAYSSGQISTIYAPNNEYWVILELLPKYQVDPANLTSLYIHSSNGQLVPLSAVAKISQDVGPASVNHLGQLPSVTISFNLAQGFALGSAVNEVQRLGREIIPADISTSFQGTAQPTPRIALADTYENFAWKARGSGFADAVTPEAWNLLGERMQKALQVLQQAEKISHDDPEWYNSMLVATSDQDWNRAQADALVDEALSKEPGYFYVLRVQADNLLPKWYGNPGDTEEFIAKAADRIGGAEGDASYFFVAEATLVAEERCSQCTPPAMSWTRIRQGYAAVERLYGTNNYERNAIAFLAVRARDAQTARDAFERIGDDWDPDVWGSKALFDSGRLFSNLKPVPHAPPKGARTTY